MLVSVVIPSYNHKKYVIKAIESVLDQTWPQVDLIVIDDGSKDGSPEAIAQLFEARGGFRFIARENRGLLKTLNQGLSLARGKFFCELASDDYFPPDSIEKRVRFLLEHSECVAVFGDGVIVRGDVLSDETFCGEKRKRMLQKDDPIPDMLKGCLPVFSTGLLRTEVLRQVGGFDEENFHYYEDLDTPIRLSLVGRLGVIDSLVICRRQHETNISTTTPYIRLEKTLCYALLLKDPRMAPYQSLLRHRFRSSLLALGRQLEKDGGKTLNGSPIFRDGWSHLWREPRLLKYLFKWGRC